ncbi:PKD domain-containing protein, partial [Candidatus Babeliales bacterium]|nr:PKD domain-containing protein [Candidatus Babeliales bacterium]
SIEDPYNNAVPIEKVIRTSDGTKIPSYNYWLRNGRILIVDHYDAGFDGNYTIIFKYSNVVPVITTNRTMFDGRIVVEENKAINFSGSDSYDEFGSIVSYKWEFGDGSPIELGENISHRYSQMGEYDVILNVTNNAGVSGQTSVKVYVVKQIVQALVLRSDFSDKTWNEWGLPIAEISENERKVADYYLEGSYGAIYINFTTYNSIIHINKNLDEYSNYIQYNIINDTIGKSTLNNITQDFVLVVATDYGQGEMAFPCLEFWSTCFSIAVVKSNSENRVWSHEIGHILGRKIHSSERFNDIDLLWDLYNEGIIKNLNGVKIYNDGSVSGEWDIMGGDSDIAPPPHLSSMSKVLLGWMEPKEVSLYDTINVRAIEQGNYGDQAFIYRSVLYNNVQYAIEAREYPRNEVVIYKLEDYDLMNDVASPANNRHTVSINNIGHLDLGWNFVWFYVSEESENPYSAKVKIAHPSLYNNMAGWVVSTTKPISNNIQSWWALNESNLTDPDIDLHAYSLDGKHIGVNYSNGLYENEIQGAFSSGDLINGEEWIFVPSDINVSYYIGSHDVQKFLEENPDFNASNATIEFDATYMEYSPNTKHVQLPDGNWTISNRYVSDTQVETINPGEIKEIILKDKTPPNIVTQLTSINGTTWLNWTWTNPSDPDFNHTELYL